jgi:hypothetical protein
VSNNAHPLFADLLDGIAKGPQTLGSLGDATSARPAFEPPVVGRFQHKGWTVEVRETGKPHAPYSSWCSPDGCEPWTKSPVNLLTPKSAAGDGRLMVDYLLEGLSG